MRNRLKPNNFVLFALLTPGTILFVMCCIAPLFVAFYYSLFKWDGGPSKNFLGLLNYVQLITDKTFWGAFRNNVTFIVWTVIGQIGIAFIVSMLMVSRSLKLKTLHRTVIFFPVILSAVVVGFTWKIIYNKDYGFLNHILTLIGRADWIKAWLDDPDIVIPSLAVAKIWQYIGYYMVILLAAIQSIDKEVLEVAELDGAIGWKKSIYVVIPLIKNTFMVALMLCISGNMKTFDQIYVMTNGGPGGASEVVAMYAYRVSMERMEYGYGSAAAIGILILSLSLIGLSNLVTGKKDN
jgi:raffinose/stachyose/melibiose transport system permease protein